MSMKFVRKKEGFSMKNTQSRKLTFGAMMVALFSILLALAFYVPVVNIVASLFAVLPIAWYSATYDRSSSILIVIVGIVISFLIGGIMMLPLSLTFAVLGLVMGDAIRTKKSKLFLFMSSSLAVLITSAIQYILSVQFFGIDIIRESLDMLNESYRSSMSFAEDITGQAPIDEKELAKMFKMMEYTIPAVVTISAFMTTFVIVSMNLPLLRRFGVNVPTFAPFKDMRLPRSILWYYLGVLSVSLFASPVEGSTLYIIITNFSVVLWILFVLQGISLLFYYIDEKGLPNIVKVLVVVLSIPLYSFIMLIGILDLGFNIRSYVTGKNSK